MATIEIVHTVTKHPKTGAPIVETIVRDPVTQELLGTVTSVKVTGGPIDGFAAVIDYGPVKQTTKDTSAAGAQTGAATPLSGK